MTATVSPSGRRRNLKRRSGYPRSPYAILLFVLVLVAVSLTVLSPGILGLAGTIGAVGTIVALASVEFLRPILQENAKTSRDRAKKLSEARQIIEDLQQFLTRITRQRIAVSGIDDEALFTASEPIERSVAQIVLSSPVNELNESEVDCLLAIWLAYRWKQAKSTQGGPDLMAYHVLNDTVRSSFSTWKYSSKTKLLAIAYQKIRSNWRTDPLLPSMKSLFEGQIDLEDYRTLMFEFLSIAGQQQLYDTLRADRAEALRTHLIRLIREGRLGSYGLKAEAVSLIQQELRRHGAESSTFVVVKNMFWELDTYLESLPHLKGRAVSPKGFGFAEDAKMYQIMVRTPRQYRNADHFIDSEIRPRITSKKGFVAVLPVDQLEASVFPAEKDFLGSGIVATNYKLASFLLTGFEEQDIDVWMLLAKYDVPVADLLSILPITVLANNLPAEAFSELWKNYESLKARFHILTLPDWAGVSPADLSTFLALSFQSFRSMPNEILQEKCQDIIEEARRIRAALDPIQLELL